MYRANQARRDWDGPYDAAHGSQAAEQIRSQRLPTQIVIPSMYSDETLVRQALRSGAKGYLLKRSVAEGRTNNAIAQIIPVSVKTVEKHLGSVMTKSNVHDIAGLVRVALKHGLIFIDE